MNRILTIFKLKTREGRDEKLKELIDKKEILTVDELNFIASNFKQKGELITYNLIWVLLLNSPKMDGLKKFCIQEIEENLNTEYESFKNWDINFYISEWAFQYLTYLCPNKFDEYFEKYYNTATNNNLKMNMAQCVFALNKELGLKLMIDILPFIDYDHCTWDSIGQYVVYEGTLNTIIYLKEKIEKEEDINMKNFYLDMIRELEKNKNT
ncbi:hypothetical protein [Flavobacterium quisquiliarum]|uniref:DNA alkylation repair enzyme n=1 Tax=Flavobacterium quisquiliarum TaxID=1834436 RepID=A0ABV8WA65_9FLAO|nr:hypothetical protein [Flavobacterium quisquiliarum]MBW1654254.1 hypothetical protein [Flavobacterium quisquiliarum]NWL00753.1 hypothetical protein [Flavobacterium collinsii]